MVNKSKIEETKLLYQKKLDKQVAVYKMTNVMMKPCQRITREFMNNINVTHNFSSACPSISKEESLSMLEDTEIKDLNKYFLSNRKEASETMTISQASDQ